MKPNAKWGTAGLVLGLVVAIMLPTIAQESSPGPGTEASDRTVSTNGIAIVRSAPDEALVTLGVHTDAASAQEAMQGNAERMEDLVQALMDAGLDRNDLATATISLYPRWNDTGSEIVGFTAENQITATVTNMDRVGAIIDAGVRAGANLTGGITFRVSNGNESSDRALTEAVADAKRKAELLAATGGDELGVVLNITESGSSVPPPVFYGEAGVTADAATPILPPTLETQVSVSVVWSLV
jgi:uncharacterized protein YggE